MNNPRKLLEELGLAARKSLGQNFLVNTSSLNKIEAEIAGFEKIIEIGPGLGAMTGYMLELGKQVIAYEKDRGLSAYLKEHFAEADFSLEQGDFLEVSTEELQQTGARAIVGNLPFYITTPILQRVVLELLFVDVFIFGLQYDMAKRIAAGKGNSLALFLAATGELKLLNKLSRNSFYPIPEVDAAFMSWRREPRVKDIAGFELLLRGSFWGKRKSMRNCLLRNPHFQKSETGLKWAGLIKNKEYDSELLNKRPDQLSLDEYLRMFTELNESVQQH